MKYKAIIFDMDGTILDSEHIWRTATQDLIKSRIPDITPEELDMVEKQVKGLALSASCKYIKDILGFDHELEHLMEEKTQRALKLYKDKVHFIDGFKKFYTKAQEENLKMAIATNSDDQTLAAAIEKLNLRKFFGEHIYNITHVNNRHKPAPDLYLYAAEQLGIDPKECIAIEDSFHGVSAAVSAGMFCIGINTSKHLDYLRDSNLIIDGYKDIDLDDLLGLKE